MSDQSVSNAPATCLDATVGQYADYHSESWIVKDGKAVWNEGMFDSPEESARWKEHVAKNGSVFGLKP